MNTGIDLLTVDPTNPEAVAALVRQLHAHLTPDQCRHLVRDLRAWERRLGPAGRATLAAYARMVDRGAFVPSIVRAVADLADTPEWREVEQWRQYIRDVTAERRAA